MTLAARYLDTTNPLMMEELQALYQIVAEDFREYEMAQTALGIAFGETIVAKTGWKWVQVTDEYGSEISLTPPDYEIACHPISMIQKRLADEEPVDLAELRDETIALIEHRIAEGSARKRTA